MSGRWIDPNWVETPKEPRFCQKCGGHVMRRTNVACPPGYEDGSYPFLHLHPEDWQDDPHEAVVG